MKFKKLDALLNDSACFFQCVEIDNPSNTKTVRIQHKSEPALSAKMIKEVKSELGHISGIVEFYRQYGSISLFHDPISEETAFRIVSPENWNELKKRFSLWTKDLVNNDPDELLPEWIENCCVIGERPGTGNYYLMPSENKYSGAVFEFDHDGYLFIQRSEDFPSFINYLVTLDKSILEDISSTLRFIDTNSLSTQWVVSAYQDGSTSINLDEKGIEYTLHITCTENIFTSKSKHTELAKLTLPIPDSDGCAFVESVDIKLPDESVIEVYCEMNNFGTTLVVSEPSESHVSGTTLMDIYCDGGFQSRYQYNDSIQITFRLSK